MFPFTIISKKRLSDILTDSNVHESSSSLYKEMFSKCGKELESTKTKLNNLNKVVKDHLKTLSIANAKYDSLTGKFSKVSKENKDLKNRVSDLITENSDLRSYVDGLTISLDKMDTLKAENESLKKRLALKEETDKCPVGAYDVPDIEAKPKKSRKRKPKK